VVANKPFFATQVETIINLTYQNPVSTEIACKAICANILLRINLNQQYKTEMHDPNLLFAKIINK